MIRVLLAIANTAICLRHPLLSAKYMKRFGRLPSVANPRSQPDRMLWRKIFDRNPLYRLMSDKLAIRAYVRAHCPGLPLSEIVWVGTAAQQIPTALLRDGYIVKANNGSDRNVFVDATTTYEAITARVNRWLRTPYGVQRGEWAYRGVQPAVYVEKRVAPPAGSELIELNCHVAMGRCFMVSALADAKKPTVRRALFDRDGARLPFGAANPRRVRPIAELAQDFRLPAAFATLIRAAETLGQDCDYVRVDFLCAADRVSFGEFTVFHSSGYEAFPDPVERVFAANWDLRSAWFMRQRRRGPLGWYAALYRAAVSRDAATTATKQQRPVMS